MRVSPFLTVYSMGAGVAGFRESLYFQKPKPAASMRSRRMIVFMG